MSKNFFKFITLGFLLGVFALSQNSFAQLSGSYTIPGTPFATIKAAADSLNLVGVGAGGVTFNVTGGYTENITAPITITTTGTSGNAIIFQKSGGGANPLVTRTDVGVLTTTLIGAEGDAVFRLVGTDFITFDGIDVAADSQGIEYGYLTHKPDGTNGSQYVTIKNCVITMNAGDNYVVGINIGNGALTTASAIGVTVTDPAGMNTNITITGNTIQNVLAGMYFRGATAMYDSDFTIGEAGAGNIIQNFSGGRSTSTYGMFFIYVNSPNVQYNTIDNSATPHISTLYMVNFLIVTGDVVFSNNNMTMANNATIGYSFFISKSSHTCNSEIYENNTFASSGTLSSYSLYFINTTSSTPIKTVTGNSTVGSFNKVGGDTYVYFNSSTPSGGLETVVNNTFSNIAITSGNAFFGYYSSTGSNQDRIMHDNTLSDINAAAGLVHCIYAAGGRNSSVYNNTIANVTGAGMVYGLYCGGTSAMVYNNNVYGLTSTTTDSYCYGAYSTTATDITWYNNFFSDIKAPNSTSVAVSTRGIYVDRGTNVNLYYNTVYLDYTANTASNFSAAYSANTISTSIDLRNNIFINNVDNSIGAKALAFHGCGTATLTDLAATTNNNLYYAGTPSATNLIYYDPTNTAQTLSEYKALVSPLESASVTEMPPFVNSTTTPYNLHMNTTVATQTESGGTPVATVSVDYDGNTRNATTPDIGADEFEVSTFQLSVNISDGWNIVSIPGLITPDQNVNTWWPYRDLNANVFRYDGGYQSVTDAAPGHGYWMKHAGARTYNTGEEWPAVGIIVVPHDPIAGASGWNMIGGYELSVPTANVTTNPAGQQSGPIYAYSGGYQVATTLTPGLGYWIKLNAAAQIIIPESMAKGEVVEYFPEDWGRIVLTDATGINYTLYAINGDSPNGGARVNLDDYELPPAPPTGMFDIRFSRGRIAEDINSSVKTIDMSGVTYPLTVRVEGMDMRLMDETGKAINVNLKADEDVVISDATIQKLMVSGELIPEQYSLEQNYPNPFNPSTTINFSLPEAVEVTLTIYDVLGQKVTELVNAKLEAGRYSYQWNAQNVAESVK